jgi:prepilin peptidase CpaA
VLADSHLPLLWSLLAVAAAADVAQRRVPNVVVAPLAAAGLGAAWVGGGPWAAASGALTGVAVLVVLVLPWSLGKMGGGDVKLMAATSVWLGPGRLLAFVLLTAVVGGLVGLAARAAYWMEIARLVRGVPGGQPGGGAATLPRETVPYAVAIAAGAYLASLGWLS